MQIDQPTARQCLLIIGRDGGRKVDENLNADPKSTGGTRGLSLLRPERLFAPLPSPKFFAEISTTKTAGSLAQTNRPIRSRKTWPDLPTFPISSLQQIARIHSGPESLPQVIPHPQS